MNPSTIHLVKQKNPKHKHITQARWFQNPKSWILITQIPTYPKHEKFGTTFTLELVPTLLTLGYF